MIRLGIASVFLLGLFACHEPTQRTRTCSFFYWKTTFRLSDTEQQYLDALGCKKLYIKFADIGRSAASGQIEPYTLLQVVDTAGLDQRAIVPCFFLTNEVFKDGVDVAWLADRTLESLNSVGAGFVQNNTWDEILLDCDWTPSTRLAFFAYLTQLQQRLPKTTLTATIRLHQYQQPKKTGVPPVGRGMLMLYNTGDIESASERNSIFDSLDVRRYTANAPKDYPLPLDVALPLFSWHLVYRQGELWKIVPESIESDLQDTTRFATDGSMHTVLRPTFVASQYLRDGDVIRTERITPDVLHSAARVANTLDLATNATVAYYHLDSVLIRSFSVELLKECGQ